jgi:hypothetical protein
MKTFTLQPGESLQFTATLRNINGTSENVTQTAIWESSDQSVATVQSAWISTTGGLVNIPSAISGLVTAATISGSSVELVGTWYDYGSGPEEESVLDVSEEYNIVTEDDGIVPRYFFEFPLWESGDPVLTLEMVPTPDCGVLFQFDHWYFQDRGDGLDLPLASPFGTQGAAFQYSNGGVQMTASVSGNIRIAFDSFGVFNHAASTNLHGPFLFRFLSTSGDVYTFSSVFYVQGVIQEPPE